VPNPVSTIASASQTLTASGVFTDTQTVVVGGKTYTTQTTLTNVDGNVFIGADASTTLQNLMDAINLTGTPGTQYAAAMTRNAQVYASAKTATTLVVKAKVPGTIGNLITSTETQTNASWGAGNLAGGSGDPALLIDELIAAGQVNADMFLALKTYFPLKP
jgi:hypothetical protein